MMRKTMKLLLLGLALTVGILIQGCTEDDPSLAEINIEMKAITSLSSIKPSGRLQNTGIEFTEAYLGVTEIEFETLEEEEAEGSQEFEDLDGDGEDDNEEIEYEGNFVVDLLSGISNPEFGEVDLAPGTYEEMEFEMEPILDGDVTIFVAFNFTPDGATEAIRYEYSNNQEMEYELENESGFVLDEGTLNQILVIVDLDAMFDGVDFSAATADMDGIVRINEDSNVDLASQIMQNLSDFMEGGEDNDDDGEIDD
jgi:hypothetical protein